MKKLLCKIVGHKASPDAPYPVCERCGASQPFYGEEKDWSTWDWYGILTPWFWLKQQARRIKSNFISRYRSLKNWWKCDECGWHCGRHDPDADHIPF